MSYVNVKQVVINLDFLPVEKKKHLFLNYFPLWKKQVFPTCRFTSVSSSEAEFEPQPH